MSKEPDSNESLPVEEKLGNLLNDFREFKCIVLCNKCGSSHVEQDSLTKIKCLRCGNILDWDAKEFALIRIFDDIQINKTDIRLAFGYK